MALLTALLGHLVMVGSAAPMTSNIRNIFDSGDEVNDCCTLVGN
jgi:hypothetical protein